MAPDDLWKADSARAFLLAQKLSPAGFRSALMSVPPRDRDAWVDRVLLLEANVEDGPDLPRGCAPYLPCPVDAVIAAVDEAAIAAKDVFVDVGFGVGRVGLLVRLLTGAAVIGIEIQSTLVTMARKLARDLRLERFAVVQGDASLLARYIVIGSVFFFYCPFSGQRLNCLIDELQDIAKTRRLRLCGVSTHFPPRSWLLCRRLPRAELVVGHSL
jgi:hypothetical protein